MGAGKTTIGKQLAEKLQLKVIDTDNHIEEKDGRKISQIFKENGESYFRDLESEVLRSLPTENVIVTTSGGIVMMESNIEWMKQEGIIIYLHAEYNMLMKRLHGDQTRPLLQQRPTDQIKDLFEKRMPLYNQADITIWTANKTELEVVEEIVQRLKDDKLAKL